MPVCWPLAEAGKEIELFHAFRDAGLWTEADSVLAALENPKHRLLAPALERDLLLQFFPAGASRRREGPSPELGNEYESILEAYDQAGLPWERALTGLSLACWHRARGEHLFTEEVPREALRLACHYGLRILALDARTLLESQAGEAEIEQDRTEIGFRGPARC